MSMQVFIYRSLLLIILLILGGWLGAKLAVPPSYACLFWPPAGLALAAMFTWGRRIWLAILIGSFISNFLVSIEIGVSQHTLFITSLLISLGSTLQALFAKRLTEKLLGRGVPKLDSHRNILWFLLIAGPLSCLLAPCFGTTVQYIFTGLPTDKLLVTWLNWWLGDCFGVFIFAPLFFCFFAQPNQLWRPRLIRLGLPLAVSLMVLINIFLLVLKTEQNSIQAELNHQAIAIDRLLIEHANYAIDNTWALRDLFVADFQVSQQEFAVFAQLLLTRHPEVQALEWLPRVSHSQLAEFELSMRNQGHSNFNVVERDNNGDLIPVLPRDEYFPVAYIEPIKGNEKVLGLDSTANPISREAKQLAARSGKATATQHLPLLQLQNQLAILISVPIYNGIDQSPDSNLVGYVSSVLLPSRMVEEALKAINIDGFNIQILDLTAPHAEAVLYRQAKPTPLAHLYGLEPWRHQFAFCDRIWQLIVSPDASFISKQNSQLPWVTLTSGLSFTSLLSILLLTISGQTAQVEELVILRTAALERVNQELKSKEQTLRKSENHLRTLVQSQPECVTLLNRDGVVEDMNRAGLQMVEADNLAQIKGLKMSRLVLPNYLRSFNSMIRRAFIGEAISLEFEIKSLKDNHRWLESHVVPMRNNDGRITGLLAMTRDITERKQAEERLRLAARVFGEAHEGILITDPNAIIIDVNPMFCEITGYSRDEVIGKNPSILSSGKQGAEFYRDFWQNLLANRHWQGEIWNRRKNGDLYAELLTISALCNEQGQTIYYVGLFSDITQLKQQQQMLESMAHYDPLTQLPNRTLFADRLLQAIARSKRDKSLLAICFLDLDGFKPVNDQLGHEAGDQVLIEVGKRLKQIVREQDTVSRHGGDEFAILLGSLGSVEECEQALKRIHRAIINPINIDGHGIHVGASVGVTIYPLDEANPDALVRHADHAMYQAKLAGKNRYHIFNASENQQLIDRNNYLRIIEAAFIDQQMLLHYQPKVNIKTGHVMGAEALIRWQHTEQDMIAPQQFLPDIAGTQLEIEMGDWVILQAWQQLAQWHQQGVILEISVNISAYHLLAPGFIEHLSATLATHPDVDAHFLQLEILESTALDDLSVVTQMVKNCRDTLGVRIALDDFGTGYSSLTHLRHLPVDTVKIDRSFVSDMLHDVDDYAIVESIIGLSQSFHLEIVAEGVESQEQGTVLLLMGCDYAQGHAIAKPMPATEIPAWISAYQGIPAWADINRSELSPEQTQMAIRRISIRQWVQQIKNGLIHAEQHPPQWPTMAGKKSHFSRWLKIAKQHQYNAEWLDQISLLHEELLQTGAVIMWHFNNGDTDAARASLVELESALQRLEDCLAQYA